MPTTLPHQSLELSDAAQTMVAEAKPLLLRARELWNDAELFDDAQVAQTKAVFRAVFGTKEQLRGYTLADALVLSPADDPEMLYVMVVEEDASLSWTKAVLSVRNITFSKSITFAELLFFASASNYTAQDERTGADENQVLVSDLFQYWRRHFSKERLVRVTTRGMKEDRQQRIVRGPAVLPRMRWEARMLGCLDYTGGDGGEDVGVHTYGGPVDSIELDLVDEEALADGCAPQMFTVTFHSGDSDEEDYDRDTAPDYGVFIHECYGRGPEFIETWAEWDLYLTRLISGQWA